MSKISRVLLLLIYLFCNMVLLHNLDWLWTLSHPVLASECALTGEHRYAQLHLKLSTMSWGWRHWHYSPQMGQGPRFLSWSLKVLWLHIHLRSIRQCWQPHLKWNLHCVTILCSFHFGWLLESFADQGQRLEIPPQADPVWFKWCGTVILRTFPSLVALQCHNQSFGNRLIQGKYSLE